MRDCISVCWTWNHIQNEFKVGVADDPYQKQFQQATAKKALDRSWEKIVNKFTQCGLFNAMITGLRASTALMIFVTRFGWN